MFLSGTRQTVTPSSVAPLIAPSLMLGAPPALTRKDTTRMAGVRIRLQRSRAVGRRVRLLLLSCARRARAEGHYRWRGEQAGDDYPAAVGVATGTIARRLPR